MSNAEVLSPQKGHYVDLGAFVLFLFIFVVLSAYMAYDVVFQNGDEARIIFGAFVVIIIPLVILYFKPGRYVVIDPEKGISRPTRIRRSVPNLIPLSDIRSYSKVFSLGAHEEVIGVTIYTKKGRKVYYSDRRTPGCVTKILELLHERHIGEEASEKKQFG